MARRAKRARKRHGPCECNACRVCYHRLRHIGRLDLYHYKTNRGRAFFPEVTQYNQARVCLESLDRQIASQRSRLTAMEREVEKMQQLLSAWRLPRSAKRPDVQSILERVQ